MNILKKLSIGTVSTVSTTLITVEVSNAAVFSPPRKFTIDPAKPVVTFTNVAPNPTATNFELELLGVVK